MIQLTRIYTRGGDLGKTSLGDGARISKHATRIETLGVVDEANACLGMVRLHVKPEHQSIIERLQHDLFDIGADLCLPQDHQRRSTLRIQPTHVKRLEEEIDDMNKMLQPLDSFVLPGGTSASAALHLTRTIVRRAERWMCLLSETEAINPNLLSYLNRLSDYLFVLARIFNDNGAQDILWRPGATLIDPVDSSLSSSSLTKSEMNSSVLPAGALEI